MHENTQILLSVTIIPFLIIAFLTYKSLTAKKGWRWLNLVAILLTLILWSGTYYLFMLGSGWRN